MTEPQIEREPGAPSHWQACGSKDASVARQCWNVLRVPVSSLVARFQRLGLVWVSAQFLFTLCAQTPHRRREHRH